MSKMKDIYNEIVTNIDVDNNIVFALYDENFPESISYVKNASNMDYTFKRLIEAIYNEVDDTTEETNDILDREERYIVFINRLYVKEIEKVVNKIMDMYKSMVWRPFLDEEVWKPYLTGKLIKNSLNSFDEDFFII